MRTHNAPHAFLACPLPVKAAGICQNGRLSYSWVILSQLGHFEPLACNSHVTKLSGNWDRGFIVVSQLGLAWRLDPPIFVTMKLIDTDPLHVFSSPLLRLEWSPRELHTLQAARRILDCAGEALPDPWAYECKRADSSLDELGIELIPKQTAP